MRLTSSKMVILGALFVVVVAVVLLVQDFFCSSLELNEGESKGKGMCNGNYSTRITQCDL